MSTTKQKNSELESILSFVNYFKLQNQTNEQVYDYACNHFDHCYNKLNNDDFIIDNTIADNSYCDSDTGYNSVSDTQMSEEYNRVDQEFYMASEVMKSLAKLF